MQNVVRERVALGLRNSDTPASVLAPEALDAALADGTLQVAGGEAWRAAPGTKPFRVQVGLQQDEADKVFRSVVSDRLSRAGMPDALGTAVIEAIYVDNPTNNQRVLSVTARTDDERRHVMIALDDFITAHRRSLTPTQNSGGIAQLRARGFDPNRPDTIPANWRDYPIKIPGNVK